MHPSLRSASTPARHSLAYCTFEPPGNPVDAHPGRRKLSGDCPALGPRLRVGGPLGNAHAVALEYADDGRLIGFEGATDRRGNGLAESR